MLVSGRKGLRGENEVRKVRPTKVPVHRPLGADEQPTVTSRAARELGLDSYIWPCRGGWYQVKVVGGRGGVELDVSSNDRAGQPDPIIESSVVRARNELEISDVGK
jgi:hypothetical protein